MKHIFAFEQMTQYEQHAAAIEELRQKLDMYEEVLTRQFSLTALPKAIVWTTAENATTIFSNVPVPAYTNDNRIVMTPSITEWRDFYLSMLDGEPPLQQEVHAHMTQSFQTLTHDAVFCVLAHELTHHIDLFYDEFDDERHTSIWFEEGMCEYLSQKWTLSKEAYDQQRANDALLIAHFTPHYGMFSLDDFGVKSYETPSLAAIMLNYWRSAAAVHHLVEERYDGDVHRVFAEYATWHNGGRQQPLTQFFSVEHF